MFNMRHHERYVLLSQINATMMTIYRENQFLRDVISADFALHRESAPLPVEEDRSAEILDTRQEELVETIAGSSEVSSSRRVVIQAVTAYTTMLKNKPLKDVWEMKVRAICARGET